MNNADALLETISDYFELDPQKITINTSREEIEEWDSFAHVNLIIAIEKKFNKSFSVSDISDITNINDIYQLIKN